MSQKIITGIALLCAGNLLAKDGNFLKNIENIRSPYISKPIKTCFYIGTKGKFSLNKINTNVSSEDALYSFNNKTKSGLGIEMGAQSSDKKWRSGVEFMYYPMQKDTATIQYLEY